MEKYIFDRNNGLWYELQGDYYIPCLVLDKADIQPVGMWGRKYLCYIKEYHPVLYADLLTSGKLSSYLVEIDNRAKEMLDLLVKQMAEKQGVTEQLKAQNQMAWMRRMNNIHNAAEEIINAEKYIQALKEYVMSHELNYGNGESILTLLYEAYSEVNRMDDDQIKADFNALYQAMNGMTLREMDQVIYPICTLCRDHEKAGFVEGLKVGIRLKEELMNK